MGLQTDLPLLTPPDRCQTTEDAATTPADQPEDLYVTYKKLQRQFEFLQVQEDYIKVRARAATAPRVTAGWTSRRCPLLGITARRTLSLRLLPPDGCPLSRSRAGAGLPLAQDEQKNLKNEYLRAQEEVKRIQSVPLVIGQFLEAIDENTGIVGSTTGSNYHVRILSTLDHELLKPNSSVALHKHSNALVDILPPEADSSISMMSAEDRPDVMVGSPAVPPASSCCASHIWMLWACARVCVC